MTTTEQHNGQPAPWTWKVLGAAPAKRKPMSSRTKALIQAPLMVLVAWVIHHWLGHVIMPLIIVGLSVLVLTGGLFYEPLFKAFERFGAKLAYWVTAILNWGLLTPFFYLIFTPGRLIQKMKGADPLDRRYPDPRDTFWVPRKPVPNLDQYRKQH